MLMSKELVAKLKEFGEDKTKIVIEGFNGVGDTFTTKGKIAKGDESNPVVYENVVFLDFGYREGRPYSELVASFLTEWNDMVKGSPISVCIVSGCPNVSTHLTGTWNTLPSPSAIVEAAAAASLAVPTNALSNEVLPMVSFISAL